MTVTRMFTGKSLETGELIQFKLGEKFEVKKKFRDKANVKYKGMIVTVDFKYIERCSV